MDKVIKIHKIHTFNSRLCREGASKEEIDLFRKHYLEVLKQLSKN